MQKRRYQEFFTVPQDYDANMTREAINKTPSTWLDFYPHTKYAEFLKTLLTLLNGGTKSVWLTGNYGTGKSNAVLVTQKLFMDDTARVQKWFDDYKGKIDGSLLKDILAIREETLVVYDYNASDIRTDDGFLMRLEREIAATLDENRMTVPAKANIEQVIERTLQEGDHFLAARDEIQGELVYLNADYKTTTQIVGELKKQTDENLLSDAQRVLRKRNIYLDLGVPTFRRWISGILSANGLKRIVYIFDEFHQFIENNKENLKTFEEVSESPAINKFYLVPVTHMQIQSYWAEGSANARKANDRFHFRNLQMPSDTAFKLAAHAMKENPDPHIADEWKAEKMNLWEAVRGIAQQHFNCSDSTSADYISKESFRDILPIHPMTAFLLKSLSESALSNQRSIFEYLKGGANGQEFQEFIRAGGPEIEGKQLLTSDYLWRYFIERDDLGLPPELAHIRSEFERIKSRSFQNKDEDDEDIRVLKAVLLFCVLSRLMHEPHDRLRPTVENITLAFQGDGAIVGVDGIIRNLADKHCFSVTGGNIELFTSSVGSADLQRKKAEYENEFHKLLSDKTAAMLKEHKKNDMANFSAGRFDFCVSDSGHTILTNISAATRDKYGSGKDTGAVCLWFVTAKNKEEQLRIPDKIRSCLNQLREHRIIFFHFPALTFCDTKETLWDDYIEQYAKYMLENDSTAKEQYKKAYERLEREYFDRLKRAQIKVYTVVNEQVAINDASWNTFKDMIGGYVKRTLPCCLDCLTEQTTAFGRTGLKGWAAAGLQYEAPQGPSSQLINAFKNKGITADVSWFSQEPDHPLARIRALFDKKIQNSIGKGGSLSIRKVYIELQRAPYGMKYNALSAFILGAALRHILEKGYQWDDKVRTGALDVNTLAEIIEAAVKDDGGGAIRNEKEICSLSREDKAFILKAPLMFGIKDAVADARVEDVLLRIQNRVQQVSGRVPLWILPEYIRSTPEPLADTIMEALNKICLAGSTSSKSKTDERTSAIREMGHLILVNPEIIDAVQKYIKPENFSASFQMYVDRAAPALVLLAQDIGDISHSYCEAIKDKMAETAALLWNETDITSEIDETTEEYSVIKLLKPIAGFTGFTQYRNAFDTLRSAIETNNKLPKSLILSALPNLTGLLSAIVGNGTATGIKEGLAQSPDVIKALFFDAKKAKQIELLKERLNGIDILDGELLTIYNGLQSDFSRDEGVFLDDVRAKIESYAKDSVITHIKAEWNRITGTKTPSEWAIQNGIPAYFVLNGLSEAGDVISAIQSPESYSSDRLAKLLNVLKDLPTAAIADIQKRFFDEIVPHKFAKLNINMPSLLDFLKNKYGNQPNEWSSKLDIAEFIRRQYKGAFAPQVAEKIKQTSAEELKNRLLQLAQDNPDLGLLFLE